MRRCQTLLRTLVTAVLVGPTAHAATITVTTVADENGTGPDCSLREAISAADLDADGGGCKAEGAYGADAIVFAPILGWPATIVLTDPAGALTVRSNLDIIGPGAAQLAIDGRHTTHVFSIRSRRVTISDLTVQSGKEVDAALGGGIANVGGTVVLENCTLTGNSATYGAAGITNSSQGTLRMTNGAVTDNAGAGIMNLYGSVLTLTEVTLARNRGGGIFNGGGSTMTLTRCALTDNAVRAIKNYGTATVLQSTLTGNSAAEGAGIYNGTFGELTLADTTLSGNSTRAAGGALYNASRATATLTDCALTGNSADEGGGVYNTDGTLTLTDCTLGDNSAQHAGGGIAISASAVPMTNCTLTGNSAGTTGGAISLDSGGVTLRNSTLARNSAGAGGALASSAYSRAELTNCTLTNNTASIGGGIVNEPSGSVFLAHCTLTGNSAGAGGGIHNGGMLTLGNTIIGGNPSGGDCFANNVYGVTDDGHNLIADAASSCGLRNGMKGDIEGVDPMLGPLANNGGPTPTHALCTGASVPDPACRGPSPAIDAVPLDYCLDAQGNPLETDQRGASRLDGAACDVGAYESGAVPPPACVGDCNDDGTVTIDDLLVLVRIALGDAEAACQHGVPGGATVDVALIIQAVNRASAGCGG